MNSMLCKQLLVYLVVILSVSKTYTQNNYFNRSIFDSLKYSWGGEVRIFNGEIYVYGSFDRETQNIASRKVFLNKHTLNGNSLYSQKADILSDSTSFWPGFRQSISMHTNNKIYAVGNNVYEPYRSAGSIYLYDTIGNFDYMIEKQDSDIYFRCFTFNDDFLYVLGTMEDTFMERSQIYLVKYDTALNKIWERKWGGVDADYPRGIFPTSDGGVIFSATSGMPFYAWEGHVVKVSKDGDIVFDKNNPAVFGNGSLNLYDFDEHSSRLLFVRGYYTDPMYYMFKIELILTDTALNLAWKKSWTVDSFSVFQGAYDLWNGMRVSDGYVICGTKSRGFEGWVFKVDFEGNMIWEATYRDLPNVAWGSIHYFFITGIDTLPEDRGYVLSGSTNDSLSRQVAYIMSIDKDGCFSDDTCEAKQYVSVTYYAPAIRAQMFPNPFNNNLQIKIENAQLNDAELIITDLLGRTVGREKLRTELTNFNTQDWAKGMYVWSLVEDGLVVKSGKVVKE